MKNLAIITTHPIQYYAPVFQLLAKKKYINLKVFYTWGVDGVNKYDPDFGKLIEWDIPLLEGYNYYFTKNTSKNPGSHHYNGIINPELIHEIVDFKPNAILIYGWAYHSHLKCLRYFKNKIPLYFRGDSTLLNKSTNNVKSLLKNTFKSLFLRWVYSHVDHAFYVGTENKKYYLKYGLKEKNLTFSPHAIDNNRFSNTKTPNYIKESLKKDDEIIFLFAGKLENNKNPELLIKAFIKLQKLTAVRTKLLIVGNGYLENSCKKIVIESETKNIFFYEFQNQSQMPLFYQAADIFCLPSVSETWGLSVNEAMASGNAIIVSDKVGCGIDLVHNNGIIFKAGNESELVKALLKIIEDYKLMGELSKVYIKDWSFQKQVDCIYNKINFNDIEY